MINFGDVGSGKSTSLNWMFERYLKLKPELSKLYNDNIDDYIFESNGSALAVT